MGAVVTGPGRGLRVQIVLALAGLLVLAFVPLFFAIASIGRTALVAEREDGARALASVVAHDVEAARAQNASAPALVIHDILASYVHAGALEAVAAFDAQGQMVASAGAEAAALVAPPELIARRVVERPAARFARARVVRTPHVRVLEVAAPAGEFLVVARVFAGEIDRAAPLVRLVAIYVGVFAASLLIFAYIVLTRLIVRPLESLAKAAGRVAGGARTLVVHDSGAREIRELGEAFGTMTTHLLVEEENLKKKIDELTRTTRRLTETNVQLERSDRMASVGRLAAGVAHEIGNPLAALLGLEDLVLDGGLDATAQRDFMLRMKKETERINGVVHDLLDFAREGPEGSGVASVRAVFDDVVALVRHQKEVRNVELRVEVDATLEVGLAPGRLTQVVLNLVLNAASALGGSGEVRLRASRVGEVARLEIEDTGPGVPESLRNSIFEPFVTTKDVGQGTGLGLSVCKGIVEGARGTISVDANYREGARFVVELPALPHGNV
ncbi:MAG: HAMP domain-containing histidine kinase [Myxococcales bacterium]|nr:HAMP domain-containing histidine kinase [Myxococcales bacterium]